MSRNDIRLPCDRNLTGRQTRPASRGLAALRDHVATDNLAALRRQPENVRNEFTDVVDLVFNEALDLNCSPVRGGGNIVVPIGHFSLPTTSGRKSEAESFSPLSSAALIKTGAYLKGIIPPVPPESFGLCQFDTRVLCTPAMRDTALGPPRSVIILCAGSILKLVSKIDTACKHFRIDFRN
jgi:hypothetical protein